MSWYYTAAAFMALVVVVTADSFRLDLLLFSGVLFLVGKLTRQSHD